MMPNQLMIAYFGSVLSFSRHLFRFPVMKLETSVLWLSSWGGLWEFFWNRRNENLMSREKNPMHPNIEEVEE